MLATSHGLFRFSNLLKTSADVYCRRSQAIRGFPWDGSVQRVIYLEDCSSVTVIRESPLIAIGKPLLADFGADNTAPDDSVNGAKL